MFTTRCEKPDIFSAYEFNAKIGSETLAHIGIDIPRIEIIIIFAPASGWPIKKVMAFHGTTWTVFRWFTVVIDARHWKDHLGFPAFGFINLR
ncbi:hypothetical protein JCM33374_g3179 [Metschnikowia sp. JCM 33374]|nr:hypothetical protein JCM33374_g3179 [Metschnikowia sp. JCM 33374]